MIREVWVAVRLSGSVAVRVRVARPSDTPETVTRLPRVVAVATPGSEVPAS